MEEYQFDFGTKLYFLLNEIPRVGYVIGRERKTEIKNFKPGNSIGNIVLVNENYTLLLNDGSKWFRTNNVNDLFTSKNKLIDALENSIKEF